MFEDDVLASAVASSLDGKPSHTAKFSGDLQVPNGTED